jgi:hypothetical protein
MSDYDKAVHTGLLQFTSLGFALWMQMPILELVLPTEGLNDVTLVYSDFRPLCLNSPHMWLFSLDSEVTMVVNVIFDLVAVVVEVQEEDVEGVL